MAEGARLESVYTGNRIEGSNPSLSAITFTFLYLRRIHTTIHTVFERFWRMIWVSSSLLLLRPRASISPST